jgi:hypothetical protein
MELILGSVVSLIVQGIKAKKGTSEYLTLVIVVAISVLAAGAYTYLSDAGLWDSVVRILTTAGAFYAFILQRLE